MAGVWRWTLSALGGDAHARQPRGDGACRRIRYLVRWPLKENNYINQDYLTQRRRDTEKRGQTRADRRQAAAP